MSRYIFSLLVFSLKDSFYTKTIPSCLIHSHDQHASLVLKFRASEMFSSVGTEMDKNGPLSRHSPA